MSMQQADWITIEREYYANRLTISEIAQRFNVSLSELKAAIRVGNWKRKPVEQIAVDDHNIWIDIEREYYANRRSISEISAMFGVSIPYLNEQIRLNRWQRKQPEQVRREELRCQIALQEACRIREEMECARVQNLKREYALEMARVEEEVQRLIELDISFV